MEFTELRERFERLDREICRFLREEGLVVLQYSLAVIFIWFGGLKVLGSSPASGLVANTVFFFNPSWFVPFLGYWEVAIGICFLHRKLIRLGIALLTPQLVGTFMPLVLLPDVAFESFPVVLTMEGQYIVKNLVIMGAAMVVGGHVRD